MVGPGPVVLAAGAGLVGYVLLLLFLISSILSSFSNASSVGRLLDILKYCGLSAVLTQRSLSVTTGGVKF